MTLYMAVTADEYELPLYVTEDAAEMARWAGIRVESLLTAVWRSAKKPPMPHIRGSAPRRLRRITVDIEEDEI